MKGIKSVEICTSQKNCAKLFTVPLLELHLRDACIKDFHRVSRNCRMRFAFRVLWSAVTLSTEARTLTTFPIVCGTQPPSRQMGLTLPWSCVSNNARGANRCVLHMCAWRTVASGWTRSDIRYANFCVNSTQLIEEMICAIQTSECYWDLIEHHLPIDTVDIVKSSLPISSKYFVIRNVTWKHITSCLR